MYVPADLIVIRLVVAGRGGGRNSPGPARQMADVLLVCARNH